MTVGRTDQGAAALGTSGVDQPRAIIAIPGPALIGSGAFSRRPEDESPRSPTPRLSFFDGIVETAEGSSARRLDVQIAAPPLVRVAISRQIRSDPAAPLAAPMTPTLPAAYLDARDSYEAAPEPEQVSVQPEEVSRVRRADVPRTAARRLGRVAATRTYERDHRRAPQVRDVREPRAALRAGAAPGSTGRRRDADRHRRRLIRRVAPAGVNPRGNRVSKDQLQCVFKCQTRSLVARPGVDGAQAPAPAAAAGPRAAGGAAPRPPARVDAGTGARRARRVR